MTDKEPDEIVDRLLELRYFIQTTPYLSVILSYHTPTTIGNDNPMASSKVRKILEQLNILICECIDNSNVMNT